MQQKEKEKEIDLSLDRHSHTSSQRLRKAFRDQRKKCRLEKAGLAIPLVAADSTEDRVVAKRVKFSALGKVSGKDLLKESIFTNKKQELKRAGN